MVVAGVIEVMLIYLKSRKPISVLTGSKIPTIGLARNEKDRWGMNCRMRPIGSDGQDVGHSGVATGRGAFHFRFFSSAGDEENPH
jgi:hypothetical protein